MKNIYQKVIAILYLIVVAGLSFYSPLYKYKGRIVPISDGIGGYNHNNSDLEFGSLWSNQVDWFKFGYIFFFINLLFILLFYFFRNKPNPDVNSPIFKRKLKRELKVIAISIIAFFTFLGFIEVFNLYQENKKEKITKEIGGIVLSLVDYESKMANREKFIGHTNGVFDLDSQNKIISNSFKSSEEAIRVAYNLAVNTGYKKDIKAFKTLLETNQEALIDAYKLFVITGYYGDANSFSDLLGLNNQRINYFILKEESVKTIKLLYISGQELKEAKQKYTKIKELNSERDKLFYIKGSDYQTWLLVFGLVELFLLYVLRYSFYGVRSFSNYLKEE